MWQELYKRLYMVAPPGELIRRNDRKKKSADPITTKVGIAEAFFFERRLVRNSTLLEPSIDNQRQHNCKSTERLRR